MSHPPHRVPKPKLGSGHTKPRPRGAKPLDSSELHHAHHTHTGPMIEEIVAGSADYGDETEQLKAVNIPPSSESGNNIRVAVRCRPPNKREKDDGDCRVCVSVPTDRPGVVMVDSIPFTYDLAFPMDCTQLEVFNSVGVDIVRCACNGFNASMFAYGQTSSGKSHSMMGVPNTSFVGLIPRIARLLFAAATQDDDKEVLVETSYMEIYNEKLRDLLGKSTGNDLKVRENKQLGVHVVGLTREVVNSEQETLATIEHGTKNRTTAATLYNSESSRSHAVFEITVQSKYKVAGTDMRSRSRVSLIDLAGSERSEKLGSKGKALQEGNNINKSLTVLGRCIRALVDQANDKKTIVPFRESVLTWYLRDALSGNARTTMLAACSPVASNMEETLSTLRYAASAKNIKTKAVKNEDPAQAKIRELSAELEMMKKKLEEAESTGIKKFDSTKTMTESEKASMLAELNAQMEMLGEGGFQAHQTKSRRKSRIFQAAEVNQYPMLTCLSKDNMLSHVMTIPFKDQFPFTFGRSNLSKKHHHLGFGGKDTTAAALGLDKDGDDSSDAATSSSSTSSYQTNGFELDGLGIETRHCAFEYEDGDSSNSCLTTLSETEETVPSEASSSSSSCSSGEKELVLRAFSESGVVCVNGVPINEIKNLKPVKLKHLDRIVIGPCRLICLYLTHELSPADRAYWNYDACFTELSLRGKTIPRSVLSPARCRILDKLAKLDAEQIAQANAIASEMASNVRFCCDLIVRGDKGLEHPNYSMDEFLDSNHSRIMIELFVDTDLPQIKSARDLFEALKRPKHHEAAADENFVPPTPNTAIVQNRLLDALRDDAFDAYEKSHSSKEREALDEDGSATSSFGEGLSNKDGSLGSDDNDSENVLFDPHGVDSNLESLCTLDLDEFAEIFSQLKATHASFSKLTGGLRDAMEAEAEKNITKQKLSQTSRENGRHSGLLSGGLFRSVFNKIDKDKSGRIDHEELETALSEFNETKDVDFFDKVCIEERISNDKELTYDEFEMFLISFLQHQFYRCIESVVTNRTLFVDIGGRDINSLLSSQDHDLVMKHKLLSFSSISTSSSKQSPGGGGGGSRLKHHTSLKGHAAVMKFLEECKLGHHAKTLITLGIDNLKDLFDTTLLGDDELREADFSEDEITVFRNAIVVYDLQPFTNLLVQAGLESEMLSFVQAGLGCLPDASPDQLEKSAQQGILLMKLVNALKAKETELS